MKSLPLHHLTVHTRWATVNRLYTLFHLLLLASWIYFRVSDPTSLALPPPVFSAVFSAELILSFLWLLKQAFFWRPVSREAFPTRLPADEELPAVDVFICTADPRREPPAGVMNTVLSASGLDYPLEKLTVYLSDDGGSSLTLKAIKEAWGFARWWVPFCKKHRIGTACPEAYFCGSRSGGGGLEFADEIAEIERKYEEFKERLRKIIDEEEDGEFTSVSHPPVIEDDPILELSSPDNNIISDKDINSSCSTDGANMPRLVYVSREKKLSHPHQFKAGALNVLMRVSSIISNAPYVLILDCDMYCNNPTSVRQAMCFHLDRQLSPSLAFVQFPQKFHNVSNFDIYDASLRSFFKEWWLGMDGLRGPMLSGTGFYLKRKALYADATLLQLQERFGPSKEFIKSLSRGYRGKPLDSETSENALLRETSILASFNYEENTQWGNQIGFIFILHSNGWTSVYCNPSNPAFLGSCTTNLNDTLVQGTRWSSGLLEVGLSRFCPLVYGLCLRISILESMCYGYVAFFSLYCLPAWCLAVIPQLCLLHDIPLYPQVSSPGFFVLVLIFFSSLLKHLLDVMITGGEIHTWWNELRIWTIKSVTCQLYGTLDTLLKLLSMRKSSFVPTNKGNNEEQVKLYQMGKFDFQTSTVLLAPLVTLICFNMISLVVGVAKLAFPGMLLRKDKGKVATSVSLLSIFLSLMILLLGSVVLLF
ncbi:Cellulose synthase (UDP-forming) [Bertholletia excelsa]